MKNRVIYIAGSDGTGKTTFLNDIESELILQNKVTKHIWIRSPKILSKPLMAYCRLRGLTKYKTVNGVVYGKHEFYKSDFVSWLFPILQFFDFKIKWYFEKKRIKSNDILLFDRFSLDTLADLMVDTNRLDLHKSWIGRSFIKLTPVNTKILIPIVSEEIIRERKKDTLHDDHLKNKIEVYNILVKDLKIKSFDNNRDYKKAKIDVFYYLGLDERG